MQIFQSQQDLNIWEEDDEGLGSEPSEESKDTKPKRPPRRSRSPERDVTLAFKPERSIWESPFLAADRGLDAGYHSSQASDQSTKSSCEAEESDDILKNFGLALSLSGSHTGNGGLDWLFLYFYPRPVLAFGYCSCLHLFVCVCVHACEPWACLCENSSLVQARTTKFGQKRQNPWLRSLSMRGLIDLDVQGQS